jgi:hypothetical protein
VSGSARLANTNLLIIATFISAFLAVILWFDWIDFYNQHFFDPGVIVIANNAARILFVLFFSWLIYAPGAGIVRLVMSSSDQVKLTPAERAVLGFGIGVGIWHVAMLVLGILGLYYRIAMVGLCLAVIVTSGPHFAKVAIIGWQVLAKRLIELRQRRVSVQTKGAVLVTIGAAWLLLGRGLYPGGSGDYYTHYFYYYLEVLKNHGLAPNDVWYHYYYSKGSGLPFLGMLLTDPEAPSLTTYSCVVFAALAIVTLVQRMAPNSLWPAVAGLIYLLAYLFGGESEFQKDHARVAALVVFTAWALCMERVGPPTPFRIMAAANAIAAAIVTQVIGILLGLFVALLCLWSVLRRRWSEMWGYGAIAATTGIAILAVFVLSYMSTGLASDQPLELMLYFADFSRLDRWGVIPQVITIAWLRDNFEPFVPAFGLGAFKQLIQFMRLNVLWPFLLGPIIAAVIIRVVDSHAGDTSSVSSGAAPTSSSFAAATTLRLAALLSFFTVIALFAGRTQSASFIRLSTFFVPLVVMFGTAGSVYILGRSIGCRHHQVAWIAFPIVLLVVVVIGWQATVHWTRRLPTATANALRFLSGQFSLAKAYEHAEGPFSFGGINPGAFAAARQLPSGTPIWSTNVDAYCMVPGCRIESVVSFKMSARLDEILGGDPELAKRRLQEAGLNYFLFMKDFRMVDLLPFSQLFAPEMIGRYLGVKWSDGSTFLLTWIRPDTTAIGPDFIDAYTRRRNEPDTFRQFRFDELVPQIVAISPRLRNVTQWGREAERLLTWRQFK